MQRETGSTATTEVQDQGHPDAAPMCVLSLPGRARSGVIGLIDYLRGCEHYYADAFDDAVEFTLDTNGHVTDEQSDGASELISSILDQLGGPSRRSIRLTPDEARLLAELLDNVLHYQRDYDWRIEAAAEAACNLTDHPTESQYSTGAWALERTRAQLRDVPPRPSLRQGDILHIEGAVDPELPSEGDYEITAVSESGLTLSGENGRSYQIAHADIDERMDAEVERRFTPPGVSLPEVPDPPPAPELPWTDDDHKLKSLVDAVSTAKRNISVLKRDIAACEAGTFPTTHPERTAGKFRRQLPPWEEMIERALPRIEQLKGRPSKRTPTLLERLDETMH